MLAAFNLGAMLFALIDLALPDAARHGGTLRELRWSIAYVIVTFPVFLALAFRQQRELRRDPTQRASPVRKWLTYLTLFVAAGFLIGDLVTLVRYFLEGELTVRFLLKVLTVALIAGTGFAYYLRDLRRDDDWVAE